MAEHVVYFLGAGFSAPLGLPVTATFLARARDMFAADPQSYKHFKGVFDQIRALAVAKNYYVSDQHNIEEILSILEMESHVGGVDKTDEFARLITDVIRYHTPRMRPSTPWPPSSTSIVDLPFGRDGIWHPVGYFVVGLFNRRIKAIADTSLLSLPAIEIPDACYSVISLNYDLVLETICNFTADHPYHRAALTFAEPPSPADITKPLLAKIHGSVGSGTIVPPTWQKGKHQAVIPAWRAAFTALQTANAIRFMGYSLPETDAYVRYLLKSAAASSPNLKNIDVFCLDPSGEVRRRYEKFIDFPNLRFVNRSVNDYLYFAQNGVVNGRGLEGGHDTFFERLGRDLPLP